MAKVSGAAARKEVRHMITHDPTAPWPGKIEPGVRVHDGWLFRVTFRNSQWGNRKGFGPEFDRWYHHFDHGSTSLTPAYMADAMLKRKANPAKKRPAARKRNPGIGDYFAAGRRAAAAGAAVAAKHASAAIESARQAAEAEKSRRKCDEPTVEQAIKVLARAHGVKVNPRKRNPAHHDARGRYHDEINGKGRKAFIRQNVEGGDYSVVYALVHRDGEVQVVTSPRTAYKTIAGAEKSARKWING